MPGRAALDREQLDPLTVALHQLRLAAERVVEQPYLVRRHAPHVEVESLHPIRNRERLIAEPIRVQDTLRKQHAAIQGLPEILPQQLLDLGIAEALLHERQILEGVQLTRLPHAELRDRKVTHE